MICSFFLFQCVCKWTLPIYVRLVPHPLQISVCTVPQYLCHFYSFSVFVCIGCCVCVHVFSVCLFPNVFASLYSFSMFVSVQRFVFCIVCQCLYNVFVYRFSVSCPSLMCLFNRGDTEGTNSSKILCPMFVYVLSKFVSWLILWFMDNLWFDDLRAE